MHQSSLLWRTPTTTNWIQRYHVTTIPGKHWGTLPSHQKHRDPVWENEEKSQISGAYVWCSDLHTRWIYRSCLHGYPTIRKIHSGLWEMETITHSVIKHGSANPRILSRKIRDVGRKQTFPTWLVLLHKQKWLLRRQNKLKISKFTICFIYLE